jgi:hypothetical protein
MDVPEETEEKMWLKPWNPEDYYRETGMICKCRELELEGGSNH